MDRRVFAPYSLEPAVQKAAESYYLKLHMAVGKGVKLPSLSIAPISALLASEEHGSSTFSEKAAQGMACLSKSEFSKALNAARTSLAPHNSGSPAKATPSPSRLTRNVEPESSSSPAKESASPQREIKKSASSARPILSELQEFQRLCNEYDLDAETIVPLMKRVYDHLATQGWDQKKWEDNKTSIIVAVFWWTCQAREIELGQLPSACLKLGAPLKLVERVLGSMKIIHKALLARIAPPRTRPAASPRHGSSSTTRIGNEVSPSRAETHPSQAVEDVSPPTKRLRTSPSLSADDASQPGPSSTTVRGTTGGTEGHYSETENLARSTSEVNDSMPQASSNLMEIEEHPSAGTQSAQNNITPRRQRPVFSDRRFYFELQLPEVSEAWLKAWLETAGKA